MTQSLGIKLKNSYYVGELGYLCIANWSHDLRLKFLQTMERLLLRTHITSHPGSSFTSLLLNNITTHSHPGDIGITSVYRSYPELWKLYFTLEINSILLLKYQHLNSLSKYKIYEEIQRRLTLLFRGDELNIGNEEILVGQDISILQGSLRRKAIWMEPYLGNLILLHWRLQKKKRQQKLEKLDLNEQERKDQHGSDGNPEVEAIEEEELLFQQYLQVIERREIMCRILS